LHTRRRLSGNCVQNTAAKRGAAARGSAHPPAAPGVAHDEAPTVAGDMRKDISKCDADCGLDNWVIREWRVKLDEFFPSVNYLTPLARLPELFCGAWADRPSMWEISDESLRWTIFQFGPCGQSRLPFGSFHVSRSSRLARSPGYSIACWWLRTREAPQSRREPAYGKPAGAAALEG
jgi:hypothetical protein